MGQAEGKPNLREIARRPQRHETFDKTWMVQSGVHAKRLDLDGIVLKENKQ